MTLLRVGETGRERAAVLAPDGSIRRLPQAFGDIDAGFWTGRRADTVRRGDQVIYPRQVEEVAHAQAAVRDACLVQVKEEAHLVVTLRHAWRTAPDRDALTQEIDAYLRQHLAPELQPNRIHIVDAIPRSFLNKMLRREVREHLLTHLPEAVPLLPRLVPNRGAQELVLEAA